MIWNQFPLPFTFPAIQTLPCGKILWLVDSCGYYVKGPVYIDVEIVSFVMHDQAKDSVKT